MRDFLYAMCKAAGKYAVKRVVNALIRGVIGV
jgi:hypothetical protein